MSSDTLIPVSIDFINGDILYFFIFDTDTDFSSTIVSDGIILTPFIVLFIHMNASRICHCSGTVCAISLSAHRVIATCSPTMMTVAVKPNR